jgi:hypothetical protein
MMIGGACRCRYWINKELLLLDLNERDRMEEENNIKLDIKGME